jgi:hypothetical protein
MFAIPNLLGLCSLIMSEHISETYSSQSIGGIA